MKDKIRKFLLNLYLINLFFFILACKEKANFHNQLGIPQDRYKYIVLILDSGCSTCKSEFYKYIDQKWPEKTALVLRGRISQNTRFYHDGMLKNKFFFFDSLDHSFNLGLTGKNTEMALIKDGKISHYSFLEYQNLIAELDKLKND